MLLLRLVAGSTTEPAAAVAGNSQVELHTDTDCDDTELGLQLGKDQFWTQHLLHRHLLLLLLHVNLHCFCTFLAFLLFHLQKQAIYRHLHLAETF